SPPRPPWLYLLTRPVPNWPRPIQESSIGLPPCLACNSMYCTPGEEDFDTVFASLLGLRVGGLVIGTDSFFNTRKEQIAELSLRHRVPTIHQYREFVGAGGLMGYGTDTSDLSRQVGIYTGRILKGDNPADMPV